MDMPINLTVSVPGQTPNWDILADLVTSAGINIRSLAQVLIIPSVYMCMLRILCEKSIVKWNYVSFITQCRDRYINVIMPREEAKVIVMVV